MPPRDFLGGDPKLYLLAAEDRPWAGNGALAASHQYATPAWGKTVVCRCGITGLRRHQKRTPKKPVWQRKAALMSHTPPMRARGRDYIRARDMSSCLTNYGGFLTACQPSDPSRALSCS
jgi:hypothetical protein